MDHEENQEERATLAPSVRRHSVMSEGQIQEMRQVFDIFDKNGDGKITKDELGGVMRSLGQFATTVELHQMLLEADVDGDGSVSFEDFVDISCHSSDESIDAFREFEAEELKDAFRIFDKHNRGYITSSDLRVVLQCLGESLSEDEIEDMIEEVDVSGDGRIDFNEFVKALADPSDGFFFFASNEV